MVPAAAVEILQQGVEVPHQVDASGAVVDQALPGVQARPHLASPRRGEVEDLAVLAQQFVQVHRLALAVACSPLMVDEPGVGLAQHDGLRALEQPGAPSRLDGDAVLGERRQQFGVGGAGPHQHGHVTVGDAGAVDALDRVGDVPRFVGLGVRRPGEDRRSGCRPVGGHLLG